MLIRAIEWFFFPVEPVVVIAGKIRWVVFPSDRFSLSIKVIKWVVVLLWQAFRCDRYSFDCFNRLWRTRWCDTPNHLARFCYLIRLPAKVTGSVVNLTRNQFWTISLSRGMLLAWCNSFSAKFIAPWYLLSCFNLNYNEIFFFFVFFFSVNARVLCTQRKILGEDICVILKNISKQFEVSYYIYFDVRWSLLTPNFSCFAQKTR